MIKVITPEFNLPLEVAAIENCHLVGKPKVFLAGTIDDGNSTDWQSKVIWQMKYKHHCPDPDADESIGDIVVFNPRRDDWDDSWGVEQVEEQIKWEQTHLDEADLIVMCLSDDSKSPISLFELGLYGPQGKMVVFCTDKFYRFTNVRLTCEKYGIPLIQSTNEKDICNEIERIYNEMSMIKEMNKLRVDKYKHQQKI